MSFKTSLLSDFWFFPASAADPAPGSAPLRRVQAQIRHKRCPLRDAPIYSVLTLGSLPTPRSKRYPYFAFDYCSLVPRAQKAKWVENVPNVLKIGYADGLAIGQAWWLLDDPESSELCLCRFDRLTNHAASPCSPSHVSPITSHGRASGPAAAALRLSESGSVNASHRGFFRVYDKERALWRSNSGSQ